MDSYGLSDCTIQLHLCLHLYLYQLQGAIYRGHYVLSIFSLHKNDSPRNEGQ